MAEEALSNALRHAEARAVTVTVSAEGTGPRADRPLGRRQRDRVDPDARSIASRRLGLVSMRERIESVGGSFEIVSAPGTNDGASIVS